MRPPRSNAWRPQSAEGTCSLNPATPPPSPQPGAWCTHPSSSADPPPFSTLHLQLANPPHQLLTHLLKARVLHRGEVAGHLAMFLLLDLDHLGTTGLHPIHQLPEAVSVGRHAGLHLVVNRAASLDLLLHERAPASAEPLLRGAQLRRLVRRQFQLLLHAIAEGLLDLRPQTPRLGRVALRAHAVSLLRRQTRREQDG